MLGLGGLGHMGVKFLTALGARVTVLSHSSHKREDALRLGADDFVVTSEDRAFEANAGRFDFILDTVSAAHDYNAYLRLLRRDGTMVIVGLPDPWPLEPGALINKRRRLAGSVIGGIRETQEMLDLCAERGIASDVEVIPIQQVNEAYERTLRSDVRYRFVIDLASLREGSGLVGQRARPRRELVRRCRSASAAAPIAAPALLDSARNDVTARCAVRVRMVRRQVPTTRPSTTTTWVSISSGLACRCSESAPISGRRSA